MNFKDNIQKLRKREKLSQEELAEKLNVSRQAISKWESGECYPETEKLLTICELFKCNLDDLFKSDLKEENSITEKEEYDNLTKRFSIGVSFAIFLILIGVTLLLTILGLTSNSPSKDKYTIIGAVVVLLFAAVATPILIVLGIEQNNYKEKHRTLPNFYDLKEIDKFNKKFAVGIAASVSIILIGVIAFLTTYGLNIFDEDSTLNVVVLMIFITISVPILIYLGIQKDKYDIQKYNKLNNAFSLKEGELISKISGVIMIITTILYLILGFVFNLWKYTWILYPISGMICGIVAIILNKEN